MKRNFPHYLAALGLPLPDNLVELTLGTGFEQVVEVLPRTIKKLTVGRANFNFAE